MKYLIHSSSCSNTGKIRENNEDNFYFDGKYMEEDHGDYNKIAKTTFSNEDNMVFAVFDGMGGESNGERASYLAAKSLDEYIKSKPIQFSFPDYINKANKKILADKKSNMGTTVAAAYFLEDTIKFCNLGDSRIYLLRNNKLKQVSKDHTDASLQEKLTEKVKQKPKLTQHLGISSDEMILSPYLTSIKYHTGDKILLCSDGLTDMLEDDEICNILINNSLPKDIVEELLSTSLAKGGKDNITITIFSIEKEKNKKILFSIIFVLFLLLALLIVLIPSKNNFKIDDTCDNLIVNSKCKFSFDNKKYKIKIDNPTILEYDEDNLIGKNIGTTDVFIYYKNKKVYSKTIKVFPNS